MTKTNKEIMADKLLNQSNKTKQKLFKLYNEVNLEKKWIHKERVKETIKQAMKKFKLSFEVYEYLNNELDLDFNLDKHLAENKKSSF